MVPRLLVMRRSSVHTVDVSQAVEMLWKLFPLSQRNSYVLGSWSAGQTLLLEFDF